MEAALAGGAVTPDLTVANRAAISSAVADSVRSISAGLIADSFGAELAATVGAGVEGATGAAAGCLGAFATVGTFGLIDANSEAISSAEAVSLGSTMAAGAGAATGFGAGVGAVTGVETMGGVGAGLLAALGAFGVLDAGALAAAGLTVANNAAISSAEADSERSTGAADLLFALDVSATGVAGAVLTGSGGGAVGLLAGADAEGLTVANRAAISSAEADSLKSTGSGAGAGALAAG